MVVEHRRRLVESLLRLLAAGALSFEGPGIRGRTWESVFVGGDRSAREDLESPIAAWADSPTTNLVPQPGHRTTLPMASLARLPIFPQFGQVMSTGMGIALAGELVG
jgi:hypothetical protein